GDQQDRRRRRAPPAPALEPASGGGASVGADRRGSGGVARTNRLAVLGSLRGRPSLPPVPGGLQARGALRARRADRTARGPGRRRLLPSAPPAARVAAVRALPRRRGPVGAGAAGALIQVVVQRLRADAVLPERAYTGDAGLDLAACE